jgi:hypothetical protein
MELMWRRLPDDLRDDASHWADEMAVRAIAHSTQVIGRSGRDYHPHTEVAVEAYATRLGDLQPYPHWTGPLLSGAIQEGFFRGCAGSAGR